MYSSDTCTPLTHVLLEVKLDLEHVTHLDLSRVVHDVLIYPEASRQPQFRSSLALASVSPQSRLVSSPTVEQGASFGPGVGRCLPQRHFYPILHRHCTSQVATQSQ